MSASQLELLASLRGEVEGIARDAGRPPQESYAKPASSSFGMFSSAEARIGAAMDAVRGALAKLAPVATFETARGGSMARTVVNYSGLAVSVWSGGATAELVEAHVESLRQAYALRASAAAVVAAVGNAVVAISIAMANPLTLLHAVRSAEALKRAVDRLSAALAGDGSQARL